jgi:hypothetical protein
MPTKKQRTYQREYMRRYRLAGGKPPPLPEVDLSSLTPRELKKLQPIIEAIEARNRALYHRRLQEMQKATKETVT